MDIQPLTGQRPGTDVHHHRKAFAGDGVKHLLHQDQTLAAREVGDAPARHGKPFANGGCRMLAFRLKEHQGVTPKVLRSIHDRCIETTPHRSRAGDRIGPCRLADVRFHMDHGLGAITRGRNARILITSLGGFTAGLWSPSRGLRDSDAHESRTSRFGVIDTVGVCRPGRKGNIRTGNMSEPQHLA